RPARLRSPPSLALCVSMDAERPRLRDRVGHGRWLAVSLAPPDRPARCTEDVWLLHMPSSCHTDRPHLAASALQDAIQRSSTRRLFRDSSRRAPIRLLGMGHSQTHAALLVDWNLWWL